MLIALAAAALAYAGPPDPALPDLELRNLSDDYEVAEFYLAPVASGVWSANILTGEQVRPGEALILSDIPAGRYNVRLVDDSGASCTVSEIDFARHPTFTYTGSDCFSR